VPQGRRSGLFRRLWRGRGWRCARRAGGNARSGCPVVGRGGRRRRPCKHGARGRTAAVMDGAILAWVEAFRWDGVTVFGSRKPGVGGCAFRVRESSFADMKGALPPHPQRCPERHRRAAEKASPRGMPHHSDRGVPGVYSGTTKAPYSKREGSHWRRLPAKL
jgi:hypothetical protein